MIDSDVARARGVDALHAAPRSLDWLYVGRAEELPNPGDYTTLRIAGEPIVIARDPAGTLNAFSNMCVHRGVEVAQGAGNTRAVTCPYHGWKFVHDLDGYIERVFGPDANGA